MFFEMKREKEKMKNKNKNELNRMKPKIGWILHLIGFDSVRSLVWNLHRLFHTAAELSGNFAYNLDDEHAWKQLRHCSYWTELKTTKPIFRREISLKAEHLTEIWGGILSKITLLVRTIDIIDLKFTVVLPM